LPSDVGMNLLRIGQEALNNAIRHASARTILTLTYTPHQIQLQIQDDGQGFDPQQLSSGGFGLIGMQQRSDRLGGTFTINSQPGQGTEVRVIVPILEGTETEKPPIN
jgi:signal transduction histidine kinase